MDWIIPTSILASWIGLFVAGWIMGGNNREKSIRIKGLEDVNAHYGKMADDFTAVDRTVDRLNSRLGGGVRSLSSRNRNVPAPK